jgi:hypothetical protein
VDREKHENAQTKADFQDEFPFAKLAARRSAAAAPPDGSGASDPAWEERT